MKNRRLAARLMVFAATLVSLSCARADDPTTSSGIHAVPIGEYSIALMLALARRVQRAVRMQDSGQWTTERWKTFLGHEMRGATLGIVGYGSIGRHVARIAKNGFGMRVLALSRSGQKRDAGYCEPGVGDPEGVLPDTWFTPAQLLDLLAQSDFVLVATPLTESTHKLIGEKELRAMKSRPFVVNIARGGIIDEAALVRALKENWIAGGDGPTSPMMSSALRSSTGFT